MMKSPIPLKFSCKIKQKDVDNFFEKSKHIGKFASRLRESQAILRKSPSKFTSEHYEWIKRDADLEAIRGEPGYKELLKGKA